MNLIEKIKHWWNNPDRAPITWSNIWAVIQSWFRRRTVIHKYIEEQIDYRIELSRTVCKETNVCICSCTWDEVIYADKSCEGNCYPPMMKEKEWEEYKANGFKDKVLNNE